MFKIPTTREVLQELYENLEKQYEENRNAAYTNGYNPVAEARAGGIFTAMSMIVGIENKYGI